MKHANRRAPVRARRGALLARRSTRRPRHHDDGRPQGENAGNTHPRGRLEKVALAYRSLRPAGGHVPRGPTDGRRSFEACIHRPRNEPIASPVLAELGGLFQFRSESHTVGQAAKRPARGGTHRTAPQTPSSTSGPPRQSRLEAKHSTLDRRALTLRSHARVLDVRRGRECLSTI
jgi:hypothetical protein